MRVCVEETLFLVFIIVYCLLFQAEVHALKESVDEAKKNLKRVKQEMIKVNKEKEDIMQEADTKVKVCLPSSSSRFLNSSLMC